VASYDDALVGLYVGCLNVGSGLRLRGVGGMPQYEAGSDGKCFNIRQEVRGRIRFGSFLLLACAHALLWWSVGSHRLRPPATT